MALPRTDPRPGGLRALLLPDHNDRLELMIDEVMLHWEDTGGAGPSTVWRRFREELERHLEVEERWLLPHFAKAHPVEAQQCGALHAQLRALAARAEPELQLHARHVPTVLELQRVLRAHARRADALLYPWAVEALDAGTWREVRTQMRKLLFDAPTHNHEDQP